MTTERPADFEVGIFKMEFVGFTKDGQKWRVFNTLTKIPYFTYGTKDELTKIAKPQTAAWKRRFAAMGQLGGAWREKHHYQKKANKKPVED